MKLFNPRSLAHIAFTLALVFALSLALPAFATQSPTNLTPYVTSTAVAVTVSKDGFSGFSVIAEHSGTIYRDHEAFSNMVGGLSEHCILTEAPHGLDSFEDTAALYDEAWFANHDLILLTMYDSEGMDDPNQPIVAPTDERFPYPPPELKHLYLDDKGLWVDLIAPHPETESEHRYYESGDMIVNLYYMFIGVEKSTLSENLESVAYVQGPDKPEWYDEVVAPQTSDHTLSILAAATTALFLSGASSLIPRKKRS